MKYVRLCPGFGEHVINYVNVCKIVLSIFLSILKLICNLLRTYW